jgi:hypothetical protein
VDESPAARTASPPVDRFRCAACGNLTRFDVVASRRTRAFHHYSVGGDLTIEDEEVLDERIEQVTCRWCGASGDSIERLMAVEGAEPSGAAGGGEG